MERSGALALIRLTRLGKPPVISLARVMRDYPGHGELGLIDGALLDRLNLSAPPATSPGAGTRERHDRSRWWPSSCRGGVHISTAFHRPREGVDVLALENEPGPAMHQCGRNWVVIHAGYNFKPGGWRQSARAGEP